MQIRRTQGLHTTVGRWQTLRGFVVHAQGYAMVEYASKKEAEDAISSMNGQEFLNQPLQVTWCFTKGPARKRGARR